MNTRLLLVLALVTLVRSNDVIVGLKSDGTKFFDENRQANPALWRQMDNVTIKAPENEVIRRVVITDLRPEKDGDVKVVEGGEGQKNITIELKSPTVLRGYDFHIEAYASPDYEVQSPSINGQQSTTDIVNGESSHNSEAIPNSSEPNSDTTRKLPEFPTQKIVPGVLSKDEVQEGSEREGHNAKNGDNISTEGTTELTSTTLKNDVSTTPGTKQADSVTETNNDSNKYDQQSPVAPIPLNKNINNPVIPIVSKQEGSSNNENNEKDAPRHVRDTAVETTEKSLEKEVTVTPPVDVSTTENEKEASTTEAGDIKPVEEKLEDKEDVNAPKVHTFDNRKYTSFIPSSAPQGPTNPIEVKDDEKLRNVREANEEQKTFESLSSTTESGESTTANLNAETTTLTSDDCVTKSSESDEIDVKNPINVAKENQGPDYVPINLNDREWNQHINNPRIQSEDSNNEFPKENHETEILGTDYKTSPDHLENKNPKISAIASLKNKNESPVISTL